jgi:CDGSH-type Zn-finger protein
MESSNQPKNDRPTVVRLAAGTYYWCQCGATAHPPFCDGSHRAVMASHPELGELGPLRWKLEEDRRVALCNCKRTGTAPLCDGSHQRSD